MHETEATTTTSRRFRLVVVVVADEILGGILRKEALEFVVELRGKSLVVGQDESGAVRRLDDLGHRKRLPRAGDAEQHLMFFAGLDAAHQLTDGVGLVAARIVRAVELEIHRKCCRTLVMRAELRPKLHYNAAREIAISADSKADRWERGAAKAPTASPRFPGSEGWSRLCPMKL